MRSLDPSGAEFFERKYRDAENGDPWQFATSRYELQRYDCIVTALSGRRYRNAFEPGCSIGVLTSKLAALADSLTACDVSPTAVDLARNRCRELSNVTISCEPLDHTTNWRSYDLVVLCEVGYYFEETSWRRLIEAMVLDLKPGATVLASHWLGVSPDHLQSGDSVQEALGHRLLQPILQERHPGFRMDQWVRTR